MSENANGAESSNPRGWRRLFGRPILRPAKEPPLPQIQIHPADIRRDIPQKRSGCGNGRNRGQRLPAQSLGLDGEPAPIVVRKPETLAPKPSSEHTVLLSQVVNHILLLAVDPASQNEQ